MRTGSGPDVALDRQDPPFIVVVTNPGVDKEVIKRIEKLPDRHNLTANIWLVRSPLLVRDLCNELGMGDDPVGTGVVFRLNGTYWGRADQNTWDWMSRAV